jgi:xanthine dehydrogenase accessory factor
MQTLDHDVLQRLAIWLTREERPWLCTIVRTFGSSPRPVGSMLAVLEAGEQVGTVSGGCIEEDLLERIGAGEFSGESPKLVEYGVSAQENERLGLPCGGKLVLLIEQLNTGDSSWITAALAAIGQRQCMERHLDLDTGITQIRAVAHFTSLALSSTRLRHCFGPRMRMLLIGAGQLAQSLSELALAMDYEVIVSDPRQNILDQWKGPQLELLQGMPDDIVRKHASDRHCVIITLTHDPRIDDMALMEALCTDAWYVGALGSPRTTQKRLERLAQLDISPEQLARLHAPVGLANSYPRIPGPEGAPSRI